MARALVLGATGHIGAHVVRALLAEGHQVRAAYRREQFLPVIEGLPIERVRVDLDSLEGLDAALDECGWVFHAAGYYPRFRTPRAPAIEQGAATTRRLLERLRRPSITRVVFTSSAATIRRVPGRDATEDDAEPWPGLRQGFGRQAPTEWRPVYSAVKIAMEQEALRAAAEGLPLIVVNPSVCIGEYDAHAFSGLAVLAFAKHRIPAYVDHVWNVVYTGDVGLGQVRAAERGRIGERYLLTGANISLREFAALVARASGVPPPRLRLPYRAVVAAAWISELAAWLTRTEPLLPRQTVYAARVDQRLDGTKARRELGLPQTSVEDAVARAVAWFRDHSKKVSDTLSPKSV